jgi:hypothetical protein
MLMMSLIWEVIMSPTLWSLLIVFYFKKNSKKKHQVALIGEINTMENVKNANSKFAWDVDCLITQKKIVNLNLMKQWKSILKT